ncbi:ATP-dependent DNA helicase Q-like 3 [Acropora millepora]|uniref:ATP-dependent DNA helicase Q-like 3 n=1 Tax=Acropora millepora TaxID=45264 RepID=UPI001CF5D1B9|nr:ATP-dependent DNA helicase Q-like 3 [Acropora millepora]
MASILSDPPQFVYCTAEKVLEKSFLDELKNSNTAIHKAVSAIVVDESHTVESWTGKRNKTTGKSAKANRVFRGAYGKLSILRSMCKEGTPVLALTGTADKDTEKTVIGELLMKNPVKLFDLFCCAVHELWRIAQNGSHIVD